MSHKSARIAEMIAAFRGKALPAHYLGFFHCFNSGQFYEAHDVLEDLWLAEKQTPNYAFYKGLIQLAGAFVHLQKDCAKYPRLRPSAALLKLARSNLQQFPDIHQDLEVGKVLLVIEEWLEKLEQRGFTENPLLTNTPPKLILLSVR